MTKKADQLDPTQQNDASAEEKASQDNPPAEVGDPVSDDLAPELAHENEADDEFVVDEDDFQYTYGHLTGEDLEKARKVYVSLKRLEAKTNAIPGYTGG